MVQNGPNVSHSYLGDPTRPSRVIFGTLALGLSALACGAWTLAQTAAAEPGGGRARPAAEAPARGGRAGEGGRKRAFPGRGAPRAFRTPPPGSTSSAASRRRPRLRRPRCCGRTCARSCARPRARCVARRTDRAASTQPLRSRCSRRRAPSSRARSLSAWTSRAATASRSPRSRSTAATPRPWARRPRRSPPPTTSRATVPRPSSSRSRPGSTARTYCGGPTKDHILESGGSGVALFDYDGDGRLDIYLVTAAELTKTRERVPHRNALYRNLGGLRFEDVSSKAGVDAAAWGNGVCAGDFDDDGRLDLYVTNWGPNLLFRNQGDGTFAEVAARAGVAAGGWSTGCAFFDADADGDLDLYVARYVETSWDDVVRAQRTLTWRNGPRIMVGPAGLPGEADLFFENLGHGTLRGARRGARPRRRGPRLRLRRRRHRLRRRRRRRPLRGQRLEPELPVPQPRRRAASRAWACLRASRSTPRRARRPAWAPTPATTTATA